MIDFPCRCGYAFSLPDDLAGGMIQCPKCRLLVDIPAPSERGMFEEDGTLKISGPVARHESEEERVASLKRAFMPGRVDEHGEEIDLRMTMEDVAEAGAEDVPLAVKDELRPAAPKYDPETGELIEAIDVGAAAPPPAGPIKPPGMVTKHGPSLAAEPPLPLYRVPLALVGLRNVVVLGLFIALHFVMLATVVISASGLLFIMIVPILAFLAIPAHFANVVEEVGVEARDELPALLRQMSLGEDIFQPFTHFVVAFFLCYAPAVIALKADLWLAAAALGGGGTVFFPAVFLTTACSGSMANLRPDRVMAVIRHCGGVYPLSILLWIMALATYGAGVVTAVEAAAAFGSIFSGLTPPIHLPPAISLPLMLGGIYVVHLACWQLGLMYRDGQAKFPWVLREHQRKAPQTLPLRRQRRYGRPTEGASPSGPQV